MILGNLVGIGLETIPPDSALLENYSPPLHGIGVMPVLRSSAMKAVLTRRTSGLLRDYSGGFVLDWQIHALLVVALLAITGRFHPRSYRQAFSE